MRASPLQKIFDRYGDKSERTAEVRKEAKQALIKAVQDLVKKGELLDDGFSDKGIERVSNRKLLKLLEIAEKVQAELGSRAALVDKALELDGRAKDAGFRERLEKLRLPALYGHYKGALRRARRTS